MLQKYKIDEVGSLKERLTDAKSIVLIDYKGINIEEVDELRNRFRNAEVDYFVSKNTFIKVALNELGIKELDDYLKGPTACAVCKADEVAPAREFVKFYKEVMEEKDFPKFKIGYVDGGLMSVAQLNSLAKLPSKEELLSKTLGALNAPMTGFLGVLQGIMRQFAYAVDALAKSKAENN